MRSKVRTSYAKGLRKKFVGHFSYNWMKRQALEQASKKSLNLPVLQFLIEWQTAEGDLMIKSIPKQQKALSEVLSEDGKAPHLISTWQRTWNLLESVSTALGPLLKLPDALFRQEYVSVSPQRRKTLTWQSFKKTKCEDGDAQQELLEVPSFLYPRFKTPS